MPRYRAKSLVKQNLNLWLNDLFLRDGFYSTITTGETDVYSRDISLLQVQSVDNYPDNMVFQSAFKSWVHESGISPTDAIAPPIICSGVTVDGTFYASDPGDPSYNASYAHYRDFDNGRIIFTSPISAGSTVQAEFSYKAVTVDYQDTFANEQREFYFETAYKDNPYQTGVIVYPKENSRTLPMVVIEFLNRAQEGYELGSAANMAEFRGTFHIYSRDAADRDFIEDLLMQQERAVLFGIDFNDAPMPLTYNNDKNPAFTSYQGLARVDSPYLFKRIYIDELDTVQSVPFYNIERSRVDFLIRVYPNF